MYTRGYKVHGRRGTEPLTLVLQTGGGKMRLLEPRRTRPGLDVLRVFEHPKVRIDSLNDHIHAGLINTRRCDWYVTINDESGAVALRCERESDARAIKRYAETKMK